MKIHSKRFFGYLFFSLSLAFAFGPFTEGIIKQQNATDVVLSVVTLNSVQNKTEVSEFDELKLSKYPNLRTFINLIKIEMTPKVLKKPLKNSPDPKKGYSSKDIVKLINQLENSHSPKTKKDTVKQKNVPHPKNYSLKIDGKKWQLLKNDLNLKSDIAFIKIGDIVLKSKPQTRVENVLVKFKWFNTTRYIAFVLFFLFGFIAIRGIYKKLPGINLNPYWTSKLSDIISILFLSTLGYSTIEYLLHTLTGMSLYFNDSLFTAMGAIFYIPSTIIFTFFNSKQFSQSVEITKNGITINYLENLRHLEWTQIQKIYLSSKYLAVDRLDFPIPKKLQTYLVLKTENDFIYLVEPGLKKIKQQIITALAHNAPKVLQKSIKTLKDKW